MKKFRVSCKDQITGLEMILSECSFNEACAFFGRTKPWKVFGDGSKSTRCIFDRI